MYILSSAMLCYVMESFFNLHCFPNIRSQQMEQRLLLDKPISPALALLSLTMQKLQRSASEHLQFTLTG